MKICFNYELIQSRMTTPYLINVRKLSYDEAFNLIWDWLNKCGSIRRLDFNPDHRIKDRLKAAIKVRYFPISLNELKEENKELYNIVVLGIENL